MNADSRYPVGRHSAAADGDDFKFEDKFAADNGGKLLSGRRLLVTALVGGGLGAAAFGVSKAIDPVSGEPMLDEDPQAGGLAPDGQVDDQAPEPPESKRTKVKRKAAMRPKDGGAFLDRDDSYSQAKPSGPPEMSKPDGSGGSSRPDPKPARKKFPNPAAAAAATSVPESNLLAGSVPQVHLLRRFTFGPTAETVEEIARTGIAYWLSEQLSPDSIPDGEADRVWRAFPTASMSTAQLRSTLDRGSYQGMSEYGKATLGRQIWSKRQLYEVMVDFWANHLNVPIPSGGSSLWDVGGPYHNDVIRKHALGSFRDMLRDAMRHPAMLRYLNNDQSRKESVNENLGRELLELHTVGVDGGYTEDDVRNSAYILTGRTVDGDSNFVYAPERHYTGAVKVLEFEHANDSAEDGLEVGDAYLDYLATHPSTGRYIAHKLCVRFVSDNPSAELVDMVSRAYRISGTQIVPTLVVLLSTLEFWQSVGEKVRRPLENVAASMRALGVRPGDDVSSGLGRLIQWLGTVGHRPLNWAAPNGYPDVANAWASSGAMLQTWNLHRQLVAGSAGPFEYVPADRLHGEEPPATAEEYLRLLSRRVVHQRVRPRHRDALLRFLNEDAAGDVDAITLAEHFVPLILDSPYFALR